jgi:hypothetical protein
MSWTFSYKLVYDEQSVPLRRTLKEAGTSVVNTVNISISGRYKDLYENESSFTTSRPISCAFGSPAACSLV